MDSQNFINRMITIQNNLLDFFDNKSNSEENIKNIFPNPQIFDDHNEFKSFLHLFVSISRYHLRKYDFFEKMDSILYFIKDHISKYFSNSEIFTIFKGNRRILLFLTEQNIMSFDEHIAKKILMDHKLIKRNYHRYFLPEIKSLMDDKWFKEIERESEKYYYIDTYSSVIKEMKQEVPEHFYENRRIAENENRICLLIRNDLIKEFVQYVTINKTKLSLVMDQSIYEIDVLGDRYERRKRSSLIEYAAFFGSVKIFNYLLMNNCKLTPSLWSCAFHSGSPYIINILKENQIQPKYETFENIFINSIKYHNNKITNYILVNLLSNEVKELEKNCLKKSLNFFNYDFMQDFLNVNNNDLLDFLCKYDHYTFIDDILKKNETNYMNTKFLFSAIDKENIEIIKLLLSKVNLNLNEKKILNYNILIIFL